MSLITPRVRVRRARLQDSLNTGQNFLVTQDDAGNYGHARADEFGALKVKGAKETVFGDIENIPLTTLVQNSTPYGLVNDQLYTIYTSGGGTVSANANGNGIDLKSTSTIGSYAVIRSKKVLKFRPGYSNVVKFDATFDTAVANSLQFGGVGNGASDFYFCYNGTDFSVRKGTGGLHEVRKLVIDTAANSSETATITLDDVVFTAALIDASSDKPFTTYQIVHGDEDIHDNWLIEFEENAIYFIRKQVGALTGTFSFSSDGGATGTFSTLKTGSAITATYITQANWNGSSNMVQNLDPTTRNAYLIEYSCGNTLFKICNPDNGKFELVHILASTNGNDTIFLNQPNMFIQRGVASLGTTTPLTVASTGSFAGTYGVVKLSSLYNPLYGTIVEKNISAATETVLMVIKNRSVFNGFVTQGEVYIERMTISVSSSTAPVKIKIIKNPTTLSAGTTTNYSHYMYVDENNSLSLCDTSSETYTGGTISDQFFVDINGHLYSNFHDNEIALHQNDILLISAESAATALIDLSVTLLEDV